MIDVDSDQELPLFTPRYLNNVLQPDHGYRRVYRRRRDRLGRTATALRRVSSPYG